MSLISLKQNDFMEYRDDVKINVFHEAVKSGPKGTRIMVVDHDTGEILSDNHNKILISGAQMTACKQWGLDPIVPFPTYNEELGLDETLDYETVQPENEPIISLFAIGKGGCGATPNDTYPTRYTERIEPCDLLPFRYVKPEEDLNDDLRKQYFGRYTDEDGMVRYMFKAFDTEPQLHLRYLDGTQIMPNMWAVDSEQAAECYVETRLRVTRQDFRDYFEKVVGWEEARIDALSLLFAWYNIVDDKVYYQQIFPFSRLNFPVEWLVSLDKAIDFLYSVYY